MESGDMRANVQVGTDDPCVLCTVGPVIIQTLSREEAPPTTRDRNRVETEKSDAGAAL